MSRVKKHQGSPFILALGIGMSLLGAACAGGNAAPPPSGNPVPSIATLVSNSDPVGSPAQTLTIDGSNFMATSTVTYNGTAHAASFVDATQLTISLSTGDLNTAGSYPVVVTNPAPGGGNSNVLDVTVASPAITSLSPPSAIVGAAAQTLTINGADFLATSTVTYNGTAHAASFVNSGQLTINLSAGDQAAAGTFPVVVTNPASGGGTSNTTNFLVNNPAPTITTLSPPSAIAGAAAQTLTINGTGFVAGSTVTYNGAAHAATFVDSTHLTIALTAGDQAAAGTFPVTVTNSAPGGGTSAASNFTVNNPAPTITSLNPASALTGAAGQTLTINGTGFVAGSTVTYNGAAHATTFVDSTHLTIALTAGDQAAAGAFPVVVSNPAPGGGASSTVNFLVNNPGPTITSLNPPSAIVGAASQTLTIIGTGFIAGSTVTYNGAAHAATFVDSTHLTITLAAPDQAATGAFPVVVSNPAPGGGASSAVNFLVNNPGPTITSLNPPSAIAGAASQTLTIIGTGFIAGSTVTYNGVAHAATFVDSTHLTITLTAPDQAATGAFPVVVSNPAPGGGASSAVNFQVNNPGPTITSLNPPSAIVGAASQTLTIVGTGFIAGSTVTYNGTAHAVAFVDSTNLTITLTAGDQATAGTFPVVVTNPTPGGGASPAVNFLVNNPVPTITNLVAASTFPCDPVPTLTINGTNFFNTSTVKYAGAAKTVTFVSATQLTIPLTLGDIATPGNFDVVVTNPAPGGGDSAAVAFVVNTPLGQTLSGNGPLGAALKVYSVNTNGSTGALLCTSTTDGVTGAFSVTLDAASPEPIRLITTGGQITVLGEANGLVTSTNYPETSQDAALLSAVPAEPAGAVGVIFAPSVSGIAIGMPSTFVDSLTQGNLALGKQADVVTAHASATALINGLYGFTPGAVVEQIGTSGADGLKRELAEQGVLAEGLLLVPTSPADIRGALTTDIVDGSFDGMNSGAAVPLGTGNLPATAGTTDFLSETVSWVKGPGPVVLGGATAPTASIVKGVTACTCTPFGVGLRPGNSASMAALAFSGRQYVFIAAGTQGVISVDISDPTDPAPAVKAWTNVSTNTFGGKPVSGIAAIAGNADHPQIFAFTGSDKQVAVLDPRILVTGNPATDNPVEFHGTLNFVSGTQIQLSANTWWITSAVWDGCWQGCRVVLATVDGYTFFDPAGDTLDESKVFPVQGANQGVTGNLGPALSTEIKVANPVGTDAVLLAGNPGGIQLVDFTSNASFYISQANVQAIYFPLFPAVLDNRFDDGDGNAIDPVFQVGLLTPEGPNSVVGLMNLNGITETAGVTPDRNTFTPAGAAEVVLASATFPVEGAAIEPTKHLALLMGPTSTITVGQVQDPTTPSWKGFSDWSFYDITNSPSLSGFVIPNVDIHGVTAVASLGIVKPSTLNVSYGFLLDGSSRLALQVDLNAFLSIARQGVSGDAAHQPTGDPATATDATTTGAVMKKITW